MHTSKRFIFLNEECCLLGNKMLWRFLSLVASLMSNEKLTLLHATKQPQRICYRYRDDSCLEIYIT